MQIEQVMNRSARSLLVTLLGLALVTGYGSAVAANQQATANTTNSSSVAFSGDAAVVAFSKAQTGQTLILGGTGALLGSGGNLSSDLLATTILSNVFAEALMLQSGQAVR